MRRVFADSLYWIAVSNPRDQWHAAAMRTGNAIHDAEIVTTQEVLGEFLAHFCGHGPMVRQGSVRYVEGILADPDILVREQSHQNAIAASGGTSILRPGSPGCLTGV